MEQRSPLLSEDSYVPPGCKSVGPSKVYRPSLKPEYTLVSGLWAAICVQCVLLLLYLGYAGFQLAPLINYCPWVVDFSRETISARPDTFQLSAESIYAGKSSPSLDKAWRDLLSGANIRVSPQEFTRANQTSIELPDGGVLAWMEVTHHLHCVKMLRQWIYRTDYHPDLDKKDEEHWLLHADHCLELLRQAVMCHADTSLMAFKWEKHHERPMLQLEGPIHTCWDWEEMRTKIEPRMVPKEEMGRLINPFFVS